MTRTQLQARPRERCICSGHSLLVTNLDGVVTGAGIEGFYFEETRLLSCYEVTVGGRPLLPIAASPAKEDSFLGYLQVPGQNIYVELAQVVDSGITVGWQALLAMPTMLRDALRLNAAWQGT
jgi:hypothetical protein